MFETLLLEVFGSRAEGEWGWVGGAVSRAAFGSVINGSIVASYHQGNLHKVLEDVGTEDGPFHPRYSRGQRFVQGRCNQLSRSSAGLPPLGISVSLLDVSIRRVRPTCYMLLGKLYYIKI